MRHSTLFIHRRRKNPNLHQLLGMGLSDGRRTTIPAGMLQSSKSVATNGQIYQNMTTV